MKNENRKKQDIVENNKICLLRDENPTRRAKDKIMKQKAKKKSK